MVAIAPTATRSTRPHRRVGTLSVAAPSHRIGRQLCNVTLLLITAVFALPLLWLVLSSIDTSATLTLHFPASMTIDNFRRVLTPQTALVPMRNSLIISLSVALIAVVLAVLAAYPLSRYESRFNRPFLYAILFQTCLPITAMMVPVYSLFVWLHLVDSMAGTIAFLSASSLPVAIWMMKNFMDSVPIELEEAAWVDGSSSMRALRSIVLPLMRPGILVVFIWVFIGAWGNFFVPFILLLSPEKQPAAAAIYKFFGQYGTVDYGLLAAFSLLYAVPVVVLYFIVQRFMGGNFALAGAVKG